MANTEAFNCVIVWNGRDVILPSSPWIMIGMHHIYAREAERSHRHCKLQYKMPFFLYETLFDVIDYHSSDWGHHYANALIWFGGNLRGGSGDDYQIFKR